MIAVAASACGGGGTALGGSQTGSLGPTATTGTGPPASAASPTPAPTPTPPATDLMAYVPTQDGNVVPVDVTQDRADAPIPADLHPEAIAITPNGRTAYVADAFAATVTPIDLDTGVVGAPIQITATPNTGISAIAISPDGATAYVAVVTAAQATGVIVPIDLATGVPGVGMVVGSDPVAIAITPDGSTAYVADYGDGTIAPIDLAKASVLPKILVGGNPIDIGITPSGDAAYVMDGLDANAVIPITLSANPTRDVVGSAISGVSGEAVAIAIAPDGATAVIAGDTGASLISLPSGAALGTPISGEFTAAAVTPDGTTALLGYTDGTGGTQGVLPVKLSGGASAAPIILAGEPVAIAIRP